MPIVGTNSYSIKYHRRHHASFPLRRRFATLTLTTTSLPSAAARDAPDALRLAHCMALFTSVFKTETSTESARWDVQGIAPEVCHDGLPLPSRIVDTFYVRIAATTVC
jgi:hypothetical protein